MAATSWNLPLMSSSASNLPVARSEAAETKRDKRTAQPQHLTGQPPDPAPTRSKLDASSLRSLHQHQPIHQCPCRHAPLSRPCLCLTRTDRRPFLAVSCTKMGLKNLPWASAIEPH
ncbi:hypothetical protein K456DRAFT_1676316 [Colletotrichum gloeosporioides 23]|nr:hypothetical protein K456DRAFT_1676316 [Colletotrichum gloeosporioides 23]